MKNLKILSISLLLLLLACAGAQAQHDGYSTITYAVSFPLGNTKDFTDKVSWRGVGFDYAKFIGGGESTSIGFSTGWMVFTGKKQDETTTRDDVTVHGTQYTYLNSFPLLVVARRYFGSESIKAFGGLGLGTIHNKQRLEIGTFAFEENQWHFALAPEFGVKFQLSYDVYLDLFGRYNYSFAAGDTDAQSYLSLQTGISWMF